MSDGTFDFVSKCESDIKLITTRLETVIRDKNDTQNELRDKVADLITNGLKSDAYCKAGEYLAEMNTFECCEMIDIFCEDILNKLSDMREQRECPIECRKAASSLMFAAAKFADFPELDELRTTLFERYGSLDGYVDKELAECLKLDKKLDLLQEIAAERNLDATWIANRNRKLKITLADIPTSSKRKTKLKTITHPETPQEYFTMLHRVCERAQSIARNPNAAAAAEKEELRSKIIELNSMYVKTDSELDYLSTLDFRGNLYIGCNVSTDAVQRYKVSHDEEVNNRIVEKVVLRRNVPN